MIRFFPSAAFCLASLLACTAREARADFVGYYALGNFTLTETPSSFFANGYVTPTGTSSIVLTGPQTGSGLESSTELTIASQAAGFFEFSYNYATLNSPTFTTAGYILAGTYYQLVDTNGEAGSVDVPVVAGEIIGFEVVSVDNQGAGPGNLTVSGFSAPLGASGVPEPGTFQLLLALAAAVTVARNLRRIRFPRRPRAGIAAMAVAAICFAVPMRAQQQVSYYSSAVTGKLSLINVVNASEVAAQPAGAEKLLHSALAAKGLSHPASPRLRPPTPSMRLHPEMATGGTQAAALGAIPVVEGLSLEPLSGASGFNALSHYDQREAYGGNQFTLEPPSPSVAVGNGYVLEGVNNAIQIYNTSGTRALHVVLASNQLFGLSPAIDYSEPELCPPGDNQYVQGVYLTDMRVYYDSGISRWFVVQRSQDNDICGDLLETSHLYIAVSQTADPTGNYNIYLMSTTDGGNYNCPCIADYPQLGSDEYGFHIAWNEYNSAEEYFVDAAILSVSKAALVSSTPSLVATPTATEVFIPFNTGFEYAIQPATTPPGGVSFLAAGGLEYFVSTPTQVPNSNQVALWAMTGTSSLATLSPSLTLNEITVNVLPYNSPPIGVQQASGKTPLGTLEGDPLEYLDGGDNRVLCLTYSTGFLFLTFQTGVQDQYDNWVDGGAYIVLSPTYRNGVLAAQVLNEGYLVVNGSHLLRPSIAVNSQPNPTGAIAVTLVGANYFPTAALIPFQTFSSPTTIEVAAAGTLPEDGFTGYAAFGGDGIARWGDYNTAVANSDGSIWMAVQYIGNFPRTTYANWNTYVVGYQN